MVIRNRKAVSTILAALLMVVIVVVASVMVYAWSTGLLGGLLVNPRGGAREALNMDAYSFPSHTFVTINIRNTGAMSVTLVTYYVKDGTGDSYGNTAWTAAQGAPQQLAPNAVSPTNFDINTGSCGCTLSGNTFTLTAGPSYTITVVTARNNQFVFTVIGQTPQPITYSNVRVAQYGGSGPYGGGSTDPATSLNGVSYVYSLQVSELIIDLNVGYAGNAAGATYYGFTTTGGSSPRMNFSQSIHISGTSGDNQLVIPANSCPNIAGSQISVSLLSSDGHSITFAYTCNTKPFTQLTLGQCASPCGHLTFFIVDSTGRITSG